MSTAIDLATRAGRLAGRLGKPLTECPYDVDDQPAETLAFTRGWQSISDEVGGAAVGDDQTAAATIDKHGNVHSPADGRFVKKGTGGGARKKPASAALAEAIESGAPDALAGADRPALMKLAKARGVSVPRGASAEKIRALLTGGRDPNPAPAAPAPKAPTAVAGIGDVVDQFQASDGMSGDDAAARVRAQLAGLKADELRQVRAELAAAGHPVGKSGRTKDQMANEIVRGTVGHLADSRVMRNVVADPGPRPGGEPSADELSEAVSSGLGTKIQLAINDDKIKAAMARYDAAGDEVSRRMADRLRAQNARGLLTPSDVDDVLADIEADRVPAAPAASSAPATRKMNAGSLGRGDRLLLPGNEVVTVRGHERTTQDGVPMQRLTVEGPDGAERVITVGWNTPMNRLTGGAGGAGTFALHEGEFAFDAATQVAAAGDYDREHGIKRDPLGRFGSGTRLGQLLKDRAGVDDDDEADHLELANGQSFDWSAKDHNGDHLLDIVGEDTNDPDEDEEEDEDGEIPEREPDSGMARLHMSPRDMRTFANTIGLALLREEMLASPMDAGDPKTELIASMLEATKTTEVDFEGNPWTQSIHLYPWGEDTWRMAAADDDGDSVAVSLTTAELKALHAQLMRQIMDENDEPRRQARARGQTAAATFAMPEQLEDYWLHDPKAVSKIRWCTRGAFRRARRALLGEGVPPEQVNGAVANLYKKACGRMPNQKKGGEMAAQTQVACGCGGHDTELAAPMMGAGPLHGEALIAPIAVDEPAPEMASTSTGWRGPLAPIDIATGDKRKFAPGALDSRVLPLPFRWQERQEKGHDGAVVVGALTGYSMLAEPEMWHGVLLPAGTLMGEGYFLDEDIIPEVRRAKHLATHGVIGPSVDLEPTMQVTYVDRDTGNEFNPHECGQDGSCPAHGEAVITEATIAGATMVPITAFAGCRAPELFARTTTQDAAFAAAPAPVCGCSQTSAVRHGDTWDGVRIAAAGTAWDAPGARSRLLEWARAESLPVDEAETDWRRFAVGFLWSDPTRHGLPADVESAYLFQIVDIIDGEPTIVPEAVFAAAMRVDSAVIPSSARREIREVLEDLYGQMADEFGLDDELHAPWVREHELSSGASADCGCADKWAAMGAPASQTAAGAYGVFGDMAPYPADAFNVQLDRLTPITIEQRPGESFARFFGHAASWRSCNRGYRGVCVPPPKNHSGYAQFHLGAVRTDNGLLSVGKVVQGEGHPDTGTGARIARAFYDRTSKTVALVRAADDKFGIKVSGVVAPGVTPEEATMLLASPPSGDWKDGEMIAVLAVNVPGHVVPRATMVDGQPVNMVAAGRFWADDEDRSVADEVLALSFAALDDALWEQDAPALMAALQGGN